MIGGVSCVQLSMIGNRAAPIPDEDKSELFRVLSCQFKDGKLEEKSNEH